MDIDLLVQSEIARLCSVDISSLGEDGTLVGYGLDSVRLLDLMIRLEEACDIEIDELDPRLAGVKTVGQLAGYVRTRLAEG